VGEGTREALSAALGCRRVKAWSPLNAEAWSEALERLGLGSKYPDLVNCIKFGFDGGIRRIVKTFTPENNLADKEHLVAFIGIMNKEIAKGRWLGPFSRDEVE
jgi:hypothetical protein